MRGLDRSGADGNDDAAALSWSTQLEPPYRAFEPSGNTRVMCPIFRPGRVSSLP